MKKQGMRRQLLGTVVSNKMDKTVVVMVERTVKHKFYHKYVRKRSKFSSHDENNACKIGDKVLITESRPLSRSKKWRVSRIVQEAI
jgi:small subunit ribosomal protein S17